MAWQVLLSGEQLTALVMGEIEKSRRVDALVNAVQQLCDRPHSGVRSWWENLSDLSATKQLVMSR
jgi:hypothetical protein